MHVNVALITHSGVNGLPKVALAVVPADPPHALIMCLGLQLHPSIHIQPHDGAVPWVWHHGRQPYGTMGANHSTSLMGTKPNAPSASEAALKHGKDSWW